MPAPLYILVVDDRPDSILFLTEFLLSRGHRIETCCSGAEACDAVLRRQVAKDPYDLLISDVAMPGMDGLTLVQEIRRQKLEVPTALYTGYATINPGLTVKASQLGCLAVMDKPLELRRVEMLIEEVCARKVSTSRIDRSGREQTREAGSDRHQPSTGALERKAKAGVRPPSAPFLAPGAATRGPITSRTVSPASAPVEAPADQEPFGGPPPAGSVVPAPSRTIEAQEKTGSVRKPSGLFLHNTASISKRNSTTARIRRTISGSHLPPSTGIGPDVAAEPGGAQAEASRAVSCAHCAKIFLVLIKRTVYNSVCVHCGGLNRIDPF